MFIFSSNKCNQIVFQERCCKLHPISSGRAFQLLHIFSHTALSVSSFSYSSGCAVKTKHCAVLICISLVAGPSAFSYIDRPFWLSSSVKCLLEFCPLFCCRVFFLLNWSSSLYMRSPLSDKRIADIFLQFIACPFALLLESADEQKF